MSRDDDPTVTWSLLPLGLAIMALTVLQIADASTWWQIATVVVMGALSLTLIARGAISATRLIRQRLGGS